MSVRSGGENAGANGKQARAKREPQCESCGQPAEVAAADSTWCMACHGAALRLGYDTDLGTLLATGEAITEEMVDA